MKIYYLLYLQVVAYSVRYFVRKIISKCSDTCNGLLLGAWIQFSVTSI
jgi:hypothetical protein